MSLGHIRLKRQLKQLFSGPELREMLGRLDVALSSEDVTYGFSCWIVEGLINDTRGEILADLYFLHCIPNKYKSITANRGIDYLTCDVHVVRLESLGKLRDVLIEIVHGVRHV